MNGDHLQWGEEAFHKGGEYLGCVVGSRVGSGDGQLTR